MSIQAILRASLKLEFAYSESLTYAELDVWYQLHEDVEKAKEEYRQQMEQENR